MASDQCLIILRNRGVEKVEGTSRTRRLPKIETKNHKKNKKTYLRGKELETNSKIAVRKLQKSIKSVYVGSKES